MKIILTGLNHKSAGIDIRERLAFDVAGSIKALKQLKSKFDEAEFVLLSTCNRVELYCACPVALDEGGIDGEELAKFLSEFHEVAMEDFHRSMYVLEDVDAVRHLLMVASSLDSLVVGESQIVAQIKESYTLASTAKSTGKILNRLFHCGFATSKKVHTTTSISSGRVSVAGVAVELAMQLFADVTSAKVVVIGAGKMGQLLVKHLLHIGSKDITVVNRSHERAVEMAQRYGIKSQKWEELNKQLVTADIVIASAGVQDYLFDKKQFSRQIAKQRKGSLLAIDIAVPRNFDPSISYLEDVFLYSVDDLSEVVEQNRAAREEDISKGMHIVEESVTEFMDWFRSKDIGPLIGKMRQQFAEISEKELKRFFAGVRQDAPCRELADTMVSRIVNRLLHCVIKNVDVVARKHGPAEAAKLVDGIVRQAEEISSDSDTNEDD
jgi:glutamyl-tRNA reductase